MEFSFKIILLFAMAVGDSINEDAEYWMNEGEKQLNEILQQQKSELARSVIIFVGDGMGMSTITSARIYKGQKNGDSGESGHLCFEKFPTVGLSKTFAVDKQVTDSAASATAMFTGVKTNFQILGLDAKATYNKCDKSVNDRSKISSIMAWAQDAGKDTGFVTTTRVTHATPAGLYAHTNNRNWECDSQIPLTFKKCVKDIALQLVEDDPGRNFKVILGGGASQFGVPDTKGRIQCNRTDGRNLAEEWKREKNNSIFVLTKQQLLNIDLVKTEYLLGLFSSDHILYAGERQNQSTNQPSLADMTIQAINILMKNPNGFVLMVEGGRIDHAHHENYAMLALEETLEFEEAIAAAISMTDKKHTLIIVTADHSHSITLNGYPKRGNDILGTSNNEKAVYETLTYANGPGYMYHRLNNSDSNIWRDLNNSGSERKNIYYRHFSPIYLSSESHGGEDVPVYAHGPSSQLFSSVYYNNYIAHAISRATCIGPHAAACKDKVVSSAVKNSYSTFFLICVIYVCVEALRISNKL
ncbi:alkaline phosphatase 4-like [Periplaneta americana]|uniref:alkaline phosphatase 4-like n=1 Tax=Periplaneta americana TaxID=6978 RepID=UPI0037E8B220